MRRGGAGDKSQDYEWERMKILVTQLRVGLENWADRNGIGTGGRDEDPRLINDGRRGTRKTG